MAQNKVQYQQGLAMLDFFDLYGSAERCETAVRALRWPDGFVCPRCQGTWHSEFRRQTRLYFQAAAEGGLKKSEVKVEDRSAVTLDRLLLAGTSQSGVQVGRHKPVIQGGPAGKILSRSPRAGLGRDCEFEAQPGSCPSSYGGCRTTALPTVSFLSPPRTHAGDPMQSAATAC